MLPPSRPPDPPGVRPGDDPGDRTRPTPSDGSNIGVVIFTTHRGERAEAILDGEGRWHCPRLPVLDRVLNILFDPRRESRGVTPFGHAELARVAAWLKGAVRVGAAGADIPP